MDEHSPLERLPVESPELPSIQEFARDALMEVMPDHLDGRTYGWVRELMRDCDILFVHEETNTSYVYYRYRYEYPDEAGFLTAIQYYIVREMSPEGIAWYGAPKHEVAIDMEYMPLPGDEEAVLFPFTYQSLGTTDELLDFITSQTEYVDETAENYAMELFDTENDD